MLMVRYRRGDKAAFAELVRRYERPLFNFALRFVRAREAARDVTQETFLRVVRRAAEFKHESRFSTWAYAIARNLCLDELRRAQHRRHPSLDETSEEGRSLGERVPDPSLDTERRAGGAELRRGIEEAVERLPEDQREVFLLRQLAGLPFAEIAKVTETPENTVKSRLRYALERLQRDLRSYEEYARALR
jgi:RNA polymerase sigma-70 factor (ECF subfamily)